MARGPKKGNIPVLSGHRAPNLGVPGSFFVFLVLLVSLVFLCAFVFCFMGFVAFVGMYLAVCCVRLQGLYSFCDS